MDRDVLLQHLATAAQHVAQGRRHLARQHDLIARLKRADLPTGEAEHFLDQLEQMQSKHLADHDRVERELAKRPAW